MNSTHHPERIDIPLHRKKLIRATLMQHALAGFALIVSASDIFSEHGQSYRWLLYVEIAVALCLVAAIIMEIVHLMKKHHTTFPWVDIWAGIVITTECVNRYLDGHLRMAIVWFAVAIMTVTVDGTSNNIQRE